MDCSLSPETDQLCEVPGDSPRQNGLGETGYFTKGTDADGNTTYTAHITGLDTSKTYKVVESKQLVDGIMS